MLNTVTLNDIFANVNFDCLYRKNIKKPDSFPLFFYITCGGLYVYTMDIALF